MPPSLNVFKLIFYNDQLSLNDNLPILMNSWKTSQNRWCSSEINLKMFKIHSTVAAVHSIDHYMYLSHRRCVICRFRWGVNSMLKLKWKKSRKSCVNILESDRISISQHGDCIWIFIHWQTQQKSIRTHSNDDHKMKRKQVHWRNINGLLKQ